MDKIIVSGGAALQGEVRISGAKNAVLQILCATLLADEPVEIANVPHLHDVRTTARLLGGLGAGIGHDQAASVVRVDPSTVDSHLAPYELVRTMRASVLVLGPLLARHPHPSAARHEGCTPCGRGRPPALTSVRGDHQAMHLDRLAGLDVLHGAPVVALRGAGRERQRVCLAPGQKGWPACLKAGLPWHAWLPLPRTCTRAPGSR